MTAKEELIQAIERSPDEVVQALLELLQTLQKRSPAEISTISQETVLKRMGGEPKHMLATGGLSDRDRRRELIAMHLQQKHRQDT
jgi:hypothetical protein